MSPAAPPPVPLLAGRVALVTGASRGIGAATARALAGAGARVARLARNLPRSDEASVSDFPCDVSRPDEVDRVVGAVLETLGVPHIVVNNAGHFLLRPMEETSPGEFEASLRVNILGPFLIARTLVPHLKQRGEGHLVTVGSVADHRAFPGNAAYAAGKYGLRGLHEVMARELRSAGIRCTLVSPGPTDTSLWDPVRPEETPGFLPRRSMLRPEDVAEAILFAVTRPQGANVELLYLEPTA